jgi:bisphosphoglycerate-dependent phosphoglycerate mutase
MNFFESFGYVHEDDIKKGRFLIEFSSVYDIPIPSENFVLKTVDPYIRACIVKDIIEDSINDDVNTNKQITPYVYTPHLHGCSDVAIFNSFRDFNIVPPPGSYLYIELFHYKGGDKRDLSKQADKKREDLLLGTVSIPIISLLDEKPSSLPFQFHKYGNISKNPSFSIILRRLHIKTSPPIYKTIFLLRHGESKWNEAQEKKDYKNLLNRDHPLTQTGIQQAQEFNDNLRDCENDMITCFGPNWRSTKREFTTDFYENLKIQDIKKNQKQCDTTDLLGLADLSSFLIDGNTYDGEFDATGSKPSYVGRDAGSDISSFFGSSSIPPTKPPKPSFSSKSTTRIHENGNAECQEELDRQSTVSIVMRQTRREEFRERFLCADKVYCSPLTRAIQTAYVGLQHHPAMMKNGLVLMSLIREIKGIAGFDSIGIAHGDAIRERVRAEFSKILGQSKTDELMLDLIYANDAAHPWWTPIQSFDTKSEQLERVLEFVNFTRYCGDEIPIFVGHSLFFKLFCSQRISSTLMKNRPALAANLRRYKLSNATVIAVALKYYDDGNEGKCDCEIIDADLIYGGGFHGGDDHETLNDDRVRVSEHDGSTRINDVDHDDDFGGAAATFTMTKKVISDKLFELQSFSKKIMSKIL